MTRSCSPAKSRYLAWLVPCVLFLGLIAVRVPFLTHPLLGEEGIFAYLVVDNGRGPLAYESNVLIARVGGQDVFNLAQHPVVSYLFLRTAFRGALPAVDFTRLTMDQQTRLAHLPFLVCFAVGLGAVFLAARRAFELSWSQALLPATLIAFASTSLLLVSGSIQPQLDGSWGVLLIGVASACLCGAGAVRTGRARATLAFLGGFVGSLGKNEWALALLAAAAVGYVASRLYRRRYGADSGQGSPGHAALWIAAGVVVGSAGVCTLSPYNFVSGLLLIEKTQSATAHLWLNTFKTRLPWIWPIVPVLLVGAAAARGRLGRLLRDELPLAVVFLWGAGMTAGFLLSSWSADGCFPRYFCPPLFALTCFAVRLLRRATLPRLAGLGLAGLLMVGVGYNLVQMRSVHRRQVSITSLPGAPLAPVLEANRAKYREFLQTGRLIETDSAFGYYFPDADFVCDGLGARGKEKVQKVLAAQSRAVPRDVAYR